MGKGRVPDPLERGALRRTVCMNRKFMHRGWMEYIKDRVYDARLMKGCWGP